MKKFKKILLGFCLCFTFLFALVACSGSKASQSYADQINSSYKNGTAITYEEAKKALKDECVDCTVNENGLLMAVKGIKASEYKEKLNNASKDEKFEFISITVVQGKCTYAYFAIVTANEALVGLK